MKLFNQINLIYIRHLHDIKHHREEIAKQQEMNLFNQKILIQQFIQHLHWAMQLQSWG